MLSVEPALEQGPAHLLAEAERQFTICNACRYCEGYCAVFPAMELTAMLTEPRLDYLANLCHDCRGCYQACMYTDPHEWGMDIPALMAEARLQSYRRHSHPRWLRDMFDGGPAYLAGLTLAAFVLFVVLDLAFNGAAALAHVQQGRGAFYREVSHLAFLVPGLAITLWFVTVLGLGALSFWGASGEPLSDLMSGRLWWRASREIATFRWMRGGGGGCYFPDEEHPSEWRRRLHSFVVYGFLLTFASTVCAFAIQSLTGSQPPYPWVSGPVLLGLIGGIGMLVGGLGLLIINARDTSGGASSRQLGTQFLLSLLAISVTGLLLLVVRQTAAMAVVLLLHLATVLALYLTIPYGKMVHAVYRTVAVLLSVKERSAEG